jgi:hypothetical protein
MSTSTYNCFPLLCYILEDCTPTGRPVCQSKYFATCDIDYKTCCSFSIVFNLFTLFHYSHIKVKEYFVTAL